MIAQRALQKNGLCSEESNCPVCPLKVLSLTTKFVVLSSSGKLYACGTKFVGLNDIPSWQKSYAKQTDRPSTKYEVNPALNEKISVWRGDITALEIDVIVNAANSRLAGGGGDLEF